jgi:hypothetical protein
VVSPGRLRRPGASRAGFDRLFMITLRSGGYDREYLLLRHMAEGCYLHTRASTLAPASNLSPKSQNAVKTFYESN